MSWPALSEANGHAPELQPGAERLLTPEQLAQRWQVKRSFVYRQAHAGRLPSVKLGRYVRFRRDAVEDFERAGGFGLEGE